MGETSGILSASLDVRTERFARAAISAASTAMTMRSRNMQRQPAAYIHRSSTPSLDTSRLRTSFCRPLISSSVSERSMER